MSATSANPGALVGQRLGKYDVVALLAMGGTAEIYLARIGGEAGFSKLVVVKVLHRHLQSDPEFTRMFRDEARLGALLHHSNVVQVLEFGEELGRNFMVMEYLPGMSLAMVARKAKDRVPGGRLPIPLVLHFAAQACAGLHYAHNRRSNDGVPLQIVHRDVSPQNMVISYDGNLKLVDFGIAKAEQRETRTATGTIKGKFAYMSPEQCLAQPLDHRTDIFALGTIVHELLTGQRLFKRDTAYETYEAIVERRPPTPSSRVPSLDRRLDDLVMRALAFDRAQRYATAEQFAEALHSALHALAAPVTAGDVSRFFQEHYQPELDAHARAMLELRAGQAEVTQGGTQLSWQDKDEEGGDRAKRETPATVALDKRSPTLLPAVGDIPEEATRIDVGIAARTFETHRAVSELRPVTAAPDEATRLSSSDSLPPWLRGNAPAASPPALPALASQMATQAPPVVPSPLPTQPPGLAPRAPGTLITSAPPVYRPANGTSSSSSRLVVGLVSAFVLGLLVTWALLA